MISFDFFSAAFLSSLWWTLIRKTESDPHENNPEENDPNENDIVKKMGHVRNIAIKL